MTPPAGSPGPEGSPPPEPTSPPPAKPPPTEPPWASTPTPTKPPPPAGTGHPRRGTTGTGTTGTGTTGTGTTGPQSDPVAEGVGRFAVPRRLHPASVLLGIPLMQLLQALVVPAFATFAAGGGITIGFLLIIGVIGLIARILSWQRKVFSFDGEVLRVDSGVLSRSHRSLDVARIQQVELQRGPLQRLFGLTAIRIETAGSASEPEVDLRVLPDDDAVALRDAVRASKARKTGKPPAVGAEGEDGTPHGREVLRVPIKHVLLASVTGARLLVLPAVIGGAFQFVAQQIGTFVDDAVELLAERGVIGPVEEVVNGPDVRLIALAVGTVAVLTVLAAMAVGVVRDGNFRIVQIEEDLYVRRGLISTRESVVPLRRVQLVEIHRNWLRRLLGYATVRVRSAGGSTGGDGRVTVPLLPEAAVDRLLNEVLPHVPGVPELTSHPPQALRRALFRWLRPAVVIIAAVWVLPELIDFLDVPLMERAQLAVLALIPVNLVLAIVEYRHLAHALTDRIVVSRRGALSITTTISPVVKVQAVSSQQNLFQRRLGLTTLISHVAGPGAVVEVMDAAEADALTLHHQLAEHAASPTHVLPPADATTPVDSGAAPVDVGAPTETSAPGDPAHSSAARESN